MSKVIHYKFKSELNQHQIPFEGSHISLHELTEAIKKKHNNTHYDLVVNLKDAISNEDKICSVNDFIPAYSFVTIRRLPLSNPSKNLKIKKTINPEDFTKTDPYKSINEGGKFFNKFLDSTSMTEEEKVENIIEASSVNYKFTGKVVPKGHPPPSYTCNKCNIAGHWINYCPGIPDKNGKLVDSKTVKRPSGIPSSGLVEVDENTPNSYLTPDGRYVVNVKNRDAILKGKKDKRPFSIEENPPLEKNPQDDIPEEMKCKLCMKLIVAPTQTRCCGCKYCRGCITDHLFDPENANSMHKCPNCLGQIDKLDELIEDSQLETLIFNWNVNKLQNKFVKPTDVVKIEQKPKMTEDDLLNEIFFMENKENEKPSNGNLGNLDCQSKAAVKTDLSSEIASNIKKLASENCVQGLIDLMKSNPKAIEMIQGIVNSLTCEKNTNKQKSRSRSRSHHKSRNYNENDVDRYYSSRHSIDSRYRESHRPSRRYREDSNYYSYDKISNNKQEYRSSDEYKSHSSYPRHHSREKICTEYTKYKNKEDYKMRRHDRENEYSYSSGKYHRGYQEYRVSRSRSPMKKEKLSEVVSSENKSRSSYPRYDSREKLGIEHTEYKNKESNQIRRHDEGNGDSHSSGKYHHEYQECRVSRSESTEKKNKLSKNDNPRHFKESNVSEKKSKKSKNKSHKKHKKSHKNEEDKKKNKKSKRF